MVSVAVVGQAVTFVTLCVAEDAGKRRGRRPGSLTSKEKEAMYRRIQRGQVARVCCVSVGHCADDRRSHAQVFLGMAAMRTQPKAEAPPLVDAMKNAGLSLSAACFVLVQWVTSSDWLVGVRFVLFSRRDERQSKAFADQLGVETDCKATLHGHHLSSFFTAVDMFSREWLYFPARPSSERWTRRQRTTPGTYISGAHATRSRCPPLLGFRLWE